MKNIIFLLILLLLPSVCHAHIQSGLVGWWKLDESSGNAVDSSGAGNTGTPTGTTIVSNCKRSGCRRFNGSSDYVSIPYTNLNFQRTNAFSFSAWANWNDVAPAGGVQTIIGRSTGGSTGTFFGWCRNAVASTCNAKSIHFSLYGNTTALSVSTATNSVDPNTWTHIVVTYSGSSTVAGTKVYKNGVDMALTTNFNNLTTTILPNVNWRIGDDYTNDWMSGQLDDVRIYNRVLTAVEVEDLYKVGTAIKGAVISGARINQ